MSDDEICLRVDGMRVTADPGRWTLARFLRERCAATSVKVGCEEGACGACTVLVDGDPVPSCVVPVGLLDGCTVETAGHLAGDPNGQRVVDAFSRHAPMQCGFCTPGLVCTATALLRSGSRPRDAELAEAVSAHVCRCTGYARYLRTIGDVLA
ncbi:2Fe-2S iron-sulfur cluster-binding protein [Acrocarpospora sp. B8E8]|uniref:(2Fe-2S)-binding protein n=1 Tax=Acrocarpospora sp. B8E8 TaxID=3153572 RepID=UPI00325D19C6